MDVYPTINVILPLVSPLTQLILVEWSLSPLSFAQVLTGCGRIQAAAVLGELEALGVLVWVDEMPELILLPF